MEILLKNNKPKGENDMVEYVIKELKDERQDLINNLRSITYTIDNINNRQTIQINAGDLSTGIYMKNIQDFCFEDLLDCLKSIKHKHEDRISRIEYILNGLEER